MYIVYKSQDYTLYYFMYYNQTNIYGSREWYFEIRLLEYGLLVIFWFTLV